ncbi:MAG: hypothetical protein CO186_05095 [Zetaproteobacteria bacterium CG_4_9_14_3_um_filter_49_83]|nr:MAG: hypothetical protein AUJ56_13305 [Zetaproteobacteria bacterium CG1_02_49_23]PIQ30541.1 MAG: hypothetical protein COW62_12095 [Zetaproteobacteria bacterium CG17_big_fil_post_rev_8_21_14_2_50_50_13]PIV30972.1 MAG: hypothetical protein COS35_03830 [Zetaproteobacteria bacterium CG02_land_8_20_14_3_00_50_9]PIY54911.1 MAG: hypothetical protein COZ00_12210 [Zetaproteobacteria bacterium CG_4_10_14_0_8_um_filter_49_80]PJA35594.1 MAG: hypothetical protein CO186_05095 [Zetaproteobacteria bacterium
MSFVKRFIFAAMKIKNPLYFHQFIVYLILGIGFIHPAWATATDELQIIKSATHINKPDSTPPTSFAEGSVVSLPHDSFPSPSESSWYLLSFSINENHQQVAAYLPLINMNASLYLNGNLIGNTGSFEEPMSRFWHTPVMFLLPSLYLKPGQNTLQVRLKPSPPNDLAQLGHIYVGDEEAIHQLYSRDYFFFYTIHLMAMSAAIFLGFIVFYLWMIRRADEYLYFSLACLSWALSAMNIVIHRPPIPTLYWEWLMQMSVGLAAVFITLFIRRLLAIKSSWIDKTILLSSLTFSIAMFLVPNHWFFITAHIWHSTVILFGLHAIILLIDDYRKHKTIHSRILAGAFAIVAAFATHDLLTQAGILPSSDRFWLDFSVPLLMLAIAIVLLRRFVDVSSGLEQANATLEDRIKEAEKRIENAYQTIVQLRTQAAVTEERQRIFSDLHDDLGAKLLSIVYQSETENQRNLARQAMDGLREIVSCSQTESFQDNWLDQLRQESLQRFCQMPFKLHWRQHTDDILLYFTPAKTAQIASVLREALTNVLKHGDQSDACVHIWIRCNAAWMSVRNQGHFQTDDNFDGNGRRNMQRRIHALHGRIRWRRGLRGGCHVIWFIPLEEIDA